MAANTATLVIRYVADTSKAQGALDQTSKKTSTFAKGLKGLKTASKVGATAIAAIGADALWKGFERLKSIDDAKAKLKGLGYSTKQVSKIMDNATTAVKGTAFGLGDAATAASQMTAAGVKPGKDLTRTLGLIGDAATIAGTDFGDMSSIFAKAASSGKVSGDVIASLTDRGIPALQLLGDQMGVSAQKASEMVSKGKVSFKTFQDAIQKGMGGAAQESGKTFSGAMANVQAALGRLGAAVLGGVFEKLPVLLNNLIGVIDKLGPAAQAMGAVLGRVFSAVVKWVTSLDFGAAAASLAPLATALQRFGAMILANVVPPIKALIPPVLEFAKTVASKVIPAVSGLLNFLVKYQSVFVPIVAGILAMVAAFKTYQIIMAAVRAVTVAYTAAQTALNAVMAANPIGLIVIALVGLVAAFVVAYKKSETFRNIVNGALNAVVTVATTVINWLKANWKKILIILTGPLGIAAALIATHWNKIAGFFRDALKNVKGIVKSGWQAVKTVTVNVVTNIVAWVRGVPQKILNALSKLKKIPGVFRDAFQAAKTKVTDIGANIVTWVRGLPQKLLNGLSTLKTKITGVFRDAFNGAKDKVTDIGGKIKDAVTAIPGKLSAKSVVSSFGDAGKAIIDAFVKGMKDASGIVSGIAGKVWDAVRGQLNKAIDKINSALESTIHIPGPDIHINPPNIAHLAQGGIVTSPTLAVIGDNKSARGEAVIPFEKWDQLTAGTGDVTVEVHLDGAVIGRYVDKRVDRANTRQARRVVMRGNA